MTQKKKQYAFVEAETKQGKKVFKLFDYVPTHEEVYNYFLQCKDNGVSVVIVESKITPETFTEFNRQVFLDKATQVAKEQFGHELKNSWQLIFSFDKINLQVYPFVAELQNEHHVSIQVIDGVILIESA